MVHGLTPPPPGTLTACSSIAVPAVLTQRHPAAIVEGWNSIFQNGIRIGPTLALTGAVGYGVVGYAKSGATEDRGGSWMKWAGAAVGTVGIVPFTLLFLSPTNNRLLAQYARLTLDEPAVRALVEKWAWLNLVRAAIPLLGTGLGLWGAL
ncbi:MAG: hypothetical protein Q9219_001530 [cf. Caloplaca sp. 3 TL-2023]